MGWATAWSFDRLRLWLEHDVAPEHAIRLSLIHTISRLALAATFICHGLIPRLLIRHVDEIAMFRDAGLAAVAGSVVSALGIVELIPHLLSPVLVARIGRVPGDTCHPLRAVPDFKTRGDMFRLHPTTIALIALVIAPRAPRAPVAPVGGSSLLLIPAATVVAAQRPATVDTISEDQPIHCADCAEWNRAHAPFQVFGNTYFVGTAGLSSVLVVTDQGLILLDGALPQSAPLIAANIRALGFRPSDVKIITTSHGHFDHVGGIRALQELTGATVVTSASTARALALGHPVPDDPQFEESDVQDFPSFAGPIRVVRDGELVRLGNVTLTANATPGHTPGATTWTWRTCEGPRCLNVVYADSLSAISNATFRFTGNATRPSIADQFRRSIEKVSELPCDILITTHPGAVGLDEKLEKRTRAGVAPGAPGDPFVTPEACRAYAAGARRALDARVQKERLEAPR